jgi:hypothetical protein
VLKISLWAQYSSDPFYMLVLFYNEFIYHETWIAAEVLNVVYCWMLVCLWIKNSLSQNLRQLVLAIPSLKVCQKVFIA